MTDTESLSLSLVEQDEAEHHRQGITVVEEAWRWEEEQDWGWLGEDGTYLIR